jgi:hypothetical protein
MKLPAVHRLCFSFVVLVGLNVARDGFAAARTNLSMAGARVLSVERRFISDQED